MQFLTKTKIDFMKYRKVFVWVSLGLLVVAIVELATDGLNLGIDFAGGTQLQVRFKDEPQLDDLRRLVEEAGLRSPQIQNYGPAVDREVLIKTPVVSGSEEGSSKELIAALNQAYNGGGGDTLDLNQDGSNAVAGLLNQNDPDGRVAAGDNEDEQAAYYADVAAKVLEVRKNLKIITDWSQLQGVDGVSAAAAGVLQNQATLGAFRIQSTENVGPQIGGELTRKGIAAVVLSLIGMLLYIWFRFELRFGIGALVAVFHDFLIVLGLFALLKFEFTLPTIAAFLTLVGYSVNDTVVIFDRVRENMRRFRRQPMVDTINMSLNQTLSRTLLTSGTTLLAVGCLFFLGGEALRGFSFVLLIGVVIGTYSSIFVASPFTLLWEQLFGHEARERRQSGGSKKS